MSRDDRLHAARTGATTTNRLGPAAHEADCNKPSSHMVAGWLVLLHPALGGQRHSSQGHPNSPNLSRPSGCHLTHSCSCWLPTDTDLARGTLQKVCSQRDSAQMCTLSGSFSRLFFCCSLTALTVQDLVVKALAVMAGLQHVCAGTRLWLRLLHRLVGLGVRQQPSVAEHAMSWVCLLRWFGVPVSVLHNAEQAALPHTR